jgi:bifunctional non-homologous end joining protein LigD
MTQEALPAGADDGTDPHRVLASLRPQAYGNTAPQKIRDPIVEPLWTGVRTLAAIDAGGATLVDADGEPIPGMADIVEGLRESLQADGVVLDGFLTKQTAHGTAIVVWPDEMPSVGRLVGLRRNRAVDTVTLKEEALAARSFASEEAVSFVATDLLWLDDTSLLDVPLLERRRLLESALAESDLVRVGAYVRFPIDSWVTSWRSVGFAGLTYKAANSRYLPGEPNPDWVITGMPRR